MSQSILAGYEPHSFFHWFETICQIPHGTYHEAALGQFLLAFAAERKLPAEQDEIGNVLIRVPASPGYEQEPPLLIQAHMDMVCVKDAGKKFDFSTDPIQLRVENDLLYADGTTLGADNGVGIAFMLAVADDLSIPHPPLELLFTVQEEVGLLGIQQFDFSRITARRMINTDSGYSHQICVSSAGSCRYRSEKHYSPTVVDGWTPMQLNISGGVGGHGSMTAHMGRACAINLAADLLHWLKKEIPVRMFSLSPVGGARYGASITGFAIPSGQEASARHLLEQRWQSIRTQYAETEPHLRYEVSHSEAEAALSPEESASIIDLLYLLPGTALQHHGEETDYVLLSNGLHKTTLTGDSFVLTGGIRWMEREACETLWDKFSTLFAMLGFSLERTVFYNSWPSRDSSVLRNKLQDAHRQLFGTDAAIEHIHGGIEVSYVMNVIPDMDAVGYAPTAINAHTTRECLYLKEVQPFWDVMMLLLKTKDN